jgi:hypothetical protein
MGGVSKLHSLNIDHNLVPMSPNTSLYPVLTSLIALRRKMLPSKGRSINLWRQLLKVKASFLIAVHNFESIRKLITNAFQDVTPCNLVINLKFPLNNC